MRTADTTWQLTRAGWRKHIAERYHHPLAVKGAALKYPLGPLWVDDLARRLVEVTPAAPPPREGATMPPRERIYSAAPAGLRRERDAALALKVLELRAIIEGRTTPPTDAEIAAHDHAGGWWLYLPERGIGRCSCSACRTAQMPAGELLPGNVRMVAAVGGGRWWALDAQRRPCAWPVATEAPDAHR